MRKVQTFGAFKTQKSETCAKAVKLYKNCVAFKPLRKKL